jgi:hypothetical protein
MSWAHLLPERFQLGSAQRLGLLTEEPPVRDHRRCRSDGLAQAEPPEHARPVGRQVDPSAQRRPCRTTLNQLRRENLPLQRRRKRRPCDPTSDDQDPLDLGDAAILPQGSHKRSPRGGGGRCRREPSMSVNRKVTVLKEWRERYAEALADHQRILRDAFAEHDGHEIDTLGDSFFVAFRRAKDAVAAVECQRAGRGWTGRRPISPACGWCNPRRRGAAGAASGLAGGGLLRGVAGVRHRRHLLGRERGVACASRRARLRGHAGARHDAAPAGPRGAEPRLHRRCHRRRPVDR